MQHLCIHGHFYQPPRENPMTGIVALQESAAPFRDWNFRITAECYRANLYAPVLDGHGDVAEEINTYEHLSFNFGPTLMRWFARYAPDLLDGLRRADEASAARNGGSGNAVAQAYHHSILPLASLEDKRTEVRWGIADFEYRFGRLPEGMWLAETAVDLATLEVMAQEGIQFVILAPGQAAAVRPKGDEPWQKLEGEGVDTSRPYRVALPDGGEMAVFFYGGEASQGVAFGGWLHDGQHMAESLLNFGDGVVSMATDGESYGHHHKRGEMALAYCIKHLRDVHGVSLTNFGAILREEAPTWEAQIVEQSAWSCAHGVGRWSENCGCVMDPKNAGKQEWRKHLRGLMNWLRDELDGVCLDEMARHGESLWEARDAYIHRLLEAEKGRNFAVPDTTDPVNRILEIQRNRLMMFTSCGWFFDNPTGLETVQILRYAERALALCEDRVGSRLQAEFRKKVAAMHRADKPVISTVGKPSLALVGEGS